MSEHDEGDAEEQYLHKDTKYWRKERKIAGAKDRSKYKKTDQQKLAKQQVRLSSEELLAKGLKRGRILSITGLEMSVDSGQGVISCVLRGTLKKEKTRLKNIITVGDWVWFESRPDREGVIVQVDERYSVLSRADNLSRRSEQLLAANIDQVLIVISVVNPPLKVGLVDRFIIAAKKGNMEPVIVVNKTDLLDEGPGISPEELERERALFKGFVEAYRALDLTVHVMSAEREEGLDELKAQMKDRASVFAGQSGTGKSTLINATTGLELATASVVDRTRKGAHTTTTTKLVPLECGGWCIDTPGIKSFGLWEIQKEELLSYFTEINEWGEGCQFSSCTHTHEPGCKVKDAVEEGEIALFRYESYRNLLEGMDQSHVRR